MAVRYGIVCDSCKKLLLIPPEGKFSRIRYDRSLAGFTAKCIPPCPNIIHFNRGMLMPYVVPDAAIQRGYADLVDCRPVAKSHEALRQVNE